MEQAEIDKLKAEMGELNQLWVATTEPGLKARISVDLAEIMMILYVEGVM